MENWIVSEITLCARRAGQPDQALVLPCAGVSMESAGDVPDDRDASSARGFLLARGVPVERLADVDWTPTLIRFNARGVTEPREFQTTGWDADQGAGTVKFPLP